MGSKKGRWIFLLVSLAFLPFLARTGLDPEKIREYAVERIYEQWRASEIATLVAPGSELHLQESVLRTPFHHHFRTHLAKDFILYTDARYPRISVEFSDGDYLWASIQIETSPGVRNLWQGHTRLVNNGYLIGVWLSGLILLAGLGLWIASTVFVVFSFLWASHWNPLGIPEYLYERCRTGFVLLQDGFSKNSLAFLIALISIAMFLAHRALRRRRWRFRLHERSRSRWLVATLVLEPILMAIGFSFYQWGEGEAWWRLYLMSWTGRFFTVPFLVHHFYFESRDARWRVDERTLRKPLKLFPLALLIPAFFYFGMGWDWLSVLTSSQEAPVLMGLKTFAIALLLGMVMGSRPFALLLGLLAFPAMIATRASPLDMAFLLGVFLDGLLVGWIVSPWMMWVEPWRLILDKKVFLILLPLTLLVGLMLSSVGIPYVVPWVLLIMAMWGFYNLHKGGVGHES
ncbi:MAG TPA: hypothetical protein VM901_03095 [Bdellovibrionota bacterium]|nr:hypothetical protein [Bdellovibrionota bacterium]